MGELLFLKLLNVSVLHTIIYIMKKDYVLTSICILCQAEKGDEFHYALVCQKSEDARKGLVHVNLLIYCDPRLFAVPEFFFC